MNIQEMNEKYISLCSRFSIPICISTIDDSEAPAQAISDNGAVSTITLNTEKIADIDYEMYLAYNIGKVLLPRLVLETERLILRRFRTEDTADCFGFMSVAEDCYMDCCKPFTEMDEEFYRRIELFGERENQYMIVLKEENKVIGTVNVCADDSRAVVTREIGYSISATYQRKGYAYEALSALINLLQNELKLDLIVAGVLEDNMKSMKLLDKLGFHKEGLRRKAIWHEGLDKPMDLVYYYRDR